MVGTNPLAQEAFWANKAECDDAEKKYYQNLYGKKVEASAAEKKEYSDDDIDFFASDEDEEPKPKPKMVAPKPKAAPSNTPKNKKPVEDTNSKKPQKKEEKKENNPSIQAPSTSSTNTATSNLYYNPANGERSFIMLKPDAVQRGLTGQIIGRFEKKGFKLIAMKFVQASQDLLKRHYADLSKKPFFPELIRYMTSGPVVPMVWEGLNVVKTGRLMLGETNPRDSKPGTIRGDFCIDVGRNICHGSDSVESATKEIQMWFGNIELASWRPVAIPWIYEDEETEPSQALKNTSQENPKDKKNVDNLGAMAGNEELLKKVSSLEIENKSLKKVTDDLKNLVIKLENRVSQLEKGKGGSAPAPAKVEEEEDDDDVDLFGSDSEDEEAKAEKERVTAERLKAYHEKKSKKPALIAKTSVLLDIKPWDDETDMNEMLKSAKSIEKEGLVWGASKLVPVGYGINKLQLMCVVEDEKVSIDELCEQIAEFEDFVQSVDVAAMSKI